MNRTGDSPPPAVRQRIAYLRRLEAPVSLADDVLRIVDATPQMRPSPVARYAVWVAAATALVASVAALAVLLGAPSRDVGPQVPAPPSASATPTPLSMLPIEGALQARVPLDDGDILVMGAFDAAWVTNGTSGVITRVGASEDAQRFDARPPVVGGGRLWLAPGLDRVWVGAGAATGLVAMDPDTGQVLDSIAIDAFPFAVVADEREVWMTDDMRSVVVAVDVASKTVSHRTVVSGPHGLALTARSAWVTSSASDAVVEIDRESGEIVRTIDVGPTPMQVFVTPDETTLLVVGRDGLPITAIDVASGEVRRGTRQITALTFVDGTPWGLLPDGHYIGPMDLRTLEFTGIYQLPSAYGEGLVYAAGSLWTTDAEELFRVAPNR